MPKMKRPCISQRFRGAKKKRVSLDINTNNPEENATVHKDFEMNNCIEDENASRHCNSVSIIRILSDLLM